jgi:UDP-N-acetylmuramate dehydrogenase
MTVKSPSSLYSDLDVRVELDAPLAPLTWFAIGGRADALVHPNTIEALQTLSKRCHRDGVPLRVLGSGANLLVDDDGVDGVVVLLDSPAFKAVEFNASGHLERMRAWGGASMEKLVMECSRRGLKGLEQMAGIPASIGGAIRMNAGGKFGAVGDAVDAVALVTPEGELSIFSRESLRFDYRHTNIPRGIVAWTSFKVTPDDAVKCRARVREIFTYKKSTQPLSASSAGCMFRNPTLADGTRESAGRLIDLAGMKGARVGGAFVSTAHGNFLAVDPGARSDDLRALVDMVRDAVAARQGVELVTEVVFWRRGEDA